MSPKPPPAGPLDGKTTPTDRRPRRVADELAEAQWFTGTPRSAICPICAASYTQRRLSERFLALARTRSQLGRLPAIDRVIPDSYVPVLCPKCESRALAGPMEPAVRITAKVDERYLEDERAAMADAVEVAT